MRIKCDHISAVGFFVGAGVGAVIARLASFTKARDIATVVFSTASATALATSIRKNAPPNRTPSLESLIERAKVLKEDPSAQEFRLFECKVGEQDMGAYLGNIGQILENRFTRNGSDNTSYYYHDANNELCAGTHNDEPVRAYYADILDRAERMKSNPYDGPAVWTLLADVKLGSLAYKTPATRRRSVERAEPPSSLPKVDHTELLWKNPKIRLNQMFTLPKTG